MKNKDIIFRQMQDQNNILHVNEDSVSAWHSAFLL